VTRALRLSVTLDGFRMDWALSDDAALFSRAEDACLQARDGARAGDRHYGLGDKTGPLDQTGRRLWTARVLRTAT
jgi:alpha-glucosidase